MLAKKKCEKQKQTMLKNINKITKNAKQMHEVHICYLNKKYKKAKEQQNNAQKNT